jgi:hypothetical protein
MKIYKPVSSKSSDIKNIIHHISLALATYEFSLSINDFIEKPTGYYSSDHFIFSQKEDSRLKLAFYYFSNSNSVLYLKNISDDPIFVDSFKMNELYQMQCSLIEILSNSKCLSKSEMIIRDIIL